MTTRRKQWILAAGILLVGLLGLGASNLPARPVAADSKPTLRFQIQSSTRSPIETQQLASWLLKNGYDVAGSNWKSGLVEVITDETGLDFLKASGLRGTILERRAPGSRGRGPDPRYLNYDRLSKKMADLAKAYPQLTRVEEIGKTTKGKAVLAMLVSTTPAATDPAALAKPAIIFDGMHHAREIMTTEIVMDVAEKLLMDHQGGDAETRDLLSRWQVWVVPMLNVDGNEIVWTSDAWWRKNARSDQSGIHGVDLNRNYAYRWGDCNGSSGQKRSDTYRGPSPSSEPETQALIALGDRVLPAASLSYHSYSELVLFPYGCQGALTGENALEERIASELAAILPSDQKANGNYTAGAPWQILYGVDGDSMSHVFSQHGTLAFTFEVNQSFQPSYSLREPTIEKHRKAWKFFLKRIDRNLLTVHVIDGKTGLPAVATISINSIPHNWQEQPFRTNSAGNYFKVLDPATAIVTAKLDDGRSVDLTVTMATSAQEITLVVP